MQLIGLEEHFVTQDVLTAWRKLPPGLQDIALVHSDNTETVRRLLDLDDERLSAMDDAGVDVQVFSLTAPGVQNLEPAEAEALQISANDILAEAVRRNPSRLPGFATLATPSPDAAARELERAVTSLSLAGAMLFGRTRDRNLDHQANEPIFEAAASLRAPLYLHPQSPSVAVREALYSGLSPSVDAAFATHGIGWHYETGIQIVRQILSGVFDRYPELQIVTGHWGEVVLFYLDRLEGLAKPAKLERGISEYFRDNVSITSSGLWSQRYLRRAIEVLGVERIMFSTDYPYRLASRSLLFSISFEIVATMLLVVGRTSCRQNALGELNANKMPRPQKGAGATVDLGRRSSG